MTRRLPIWSGMVAAALVILVCFGGWLGWRKAQRPPGPTALLAVTGIVSEEVLPGESEDKVTVRAVSGTPIYALSEGVVREAAAGIDFFFPREKVTISTLSRVDTPFADGEAFARGDIVAYIPRDILGLRRPDKRLSFRANGRHDTADYLHIALPEPEGSHL